VSSRRPPRLSQHFLHDPRQAERIADALQAPRGARVVEIGPGGGALTGPLLERGHRVTAIELDTRLATALAERWGRERGLEVVAGDALEYELPGDSGPWWVAGNLPYAITSPLVFHWLDQARRADVRRCVFLVQREVARRLAADPGTKAFGALTVGVRLVADVETLFDLGPGSFRPPPAVWSTVVRLTPHERWDLDDARRERLRALVRDLFGQRRKQIQKTLRVLPSRDLSPAEVSRVAEAAGIRLDRRPESLSIEEWLRLDAALAGETEE